MNILSILLSYQLVVLTLEIMLPIRSNTLTVPVTQIHIELSISMEIANGLSALSDCFCDKPCTDQLARPSFEIASGMPSVFQRIRI